jgi:hypothetical protein
MFCKAFLCQKIVKVGNFAYTNEEVIKKLHFIFSNMPEGLLESCQDRAACQLCQAWPGTLACTVFSLIQNQPTPVASRPYFLPYNAKGPQLKCQFFFF